MIEFEVGLSDTPIFRDGLTTSLSYAFLACKNSDTYNGVVFGSNGKLKFYPNAQFWGITQAILGQLYIGSLYNRSDYQGVYGVPQERIPGLLDRLRTQRGVVAVSNKTFESFNKFDYSTRSRSREFHPATHHIPSRDSLPVSVVSEPSGWPLLAQKAIAPTPTPRMKPVSVKIAISKIDKAKQKAADDKAKAQVKKANDKAKADLAKAKLKEKEAAAKLKDKEKAKAVADKAKAAEKAKIAAQKAKAAEKAKAAKAKLKAGAKL